VNDRASTLGHHDSRRRLGHQKGAADVQLQHLVECFRLDFNEGLRPIDAYVVDQNIQVLKLPKTFEKAGGPDVFRPCLDGLRIAGLQGLKLGPGTGHGNDPGASLRQSKTA